MYGRENLIAYTPSPNKPGNVVQPTQAQQEPSSRSNFGNLRVDAGRNAMTGITGNNIQTLDATASPVKSPVAVDTTTTLTVPLNAAAITVCSVTNGIEVSEDSTYSTYFNVPAATPTTFDCANQQYIYLQSASGSTTVSFYFTMV